MVQSITGSQLSQTVATIEVVHRPLQGSLNHSRQKQNGNAFINKIKEIYSEAFFHHYAIIVNTTEGEQLILHNLEEGFTSSIITNQERQCYSVREKYESSQFNKLFLVKELCDLRQLNNQDSADYHILKNSCIHYANHVKQYIQKYLKDINEHAVQKIELLSLISAKKIFIQKIFENILAYAKEKKSLKDLMKFTKENFVNPNLYYQMLYEAIRCGKNQSKMQILGNSIIIAVIYLINQIPVVNLLFTVPVIINSIYFIWIQNDETIFKKCFKTLATLLISGLGMLPEAQPLRYLFDLISDVITKFDIIQIQTNEVVIIGGFTIAGIIGGIVSNQLAVPILATACTGVGIKSCLLVIIGLISGGEPAAISSGAFLLEAGSMSANTAATTVSDTLVATSITVQRKAICKVCSINVTFAIGSLIGAAVGIGICKLLKRKKSK